MHIRCFLLSYSVFYLFFGLVLFQFFSVLFVPSPYSSVFFLFPLDNPAISQLGFNSNGLSARFIYSVD